MPEPSEATVTGNRKPLGYQQIDNATLQSATSLTLPTIPNGVNGVGLVIVQVEGGQVRWRDDGTAPTSSVGMIIGLATGTAAELAGELDYTGEAKKLQFIDSGGTPILNVSYYE